jgi:hypothetical protein
LQHLRERKQATDQRLCLLAQGSALCLMVDALCIVQCHTTPQ